MWFWKTKGLNKKKVRMQEYVPYLEAKDNYYLELSQSLKSGSGLQIRERVCSTNFLDQKSCYPINWSEASGFKGAKREAKKESWLQITTSEVRGSDRAKMIQKKLKRKNGDFLGNSLPN